MKYRVHLHNTQLLDSMRIDLLPKIVKKKNRENRLQSTRLNSTITITDEWGI